MVEGEMTVPLFNDFPAPPARVLMDPDIRWQQRFSNYCRALEQLEEFFDPPPLNAREQQGLIKAFEYTFELAWNTLRDLLLSQGNVTLLGSRDTLREAFRLGLISEGEAWMLMIQDRNLTSHTYNRVTADAIASHIAESYRACFQQLRARLEQRQQEEQP
jgi:nucleotidyltransferase substrate binding protein (TIGR01987 family)